VLQQQLLLLSPGDCGHGHGWSWRMDVKKFPV
jgi:hypothetical protein